MTIRPVTGVEMRRQEKLLVEYTAECSIPELGPIDPQWDIYDRLESAGMAVFGVYNEQEMIGFATLLVSVLPHYGVLAGVVESLFVAKFHRDSLAGARLMGTIEAYAENKGAKAILYSAPCGGSLEKILGKRDKRTNAVFCKALGKRR